MKNKALKILNLIFALFLAVFSISYVFAWFADGTKVPLNVGGQASAYFAYGDGLSEETAFGITEPIHLYNLSWLQNSGMIESNTYFELGKSINMSDYWLAPIGNDANPFEGVFNGNGYTISNLKVTTDKSRLRFNDPAAADGTNGTKNYAFSNSVGMFGKTLGNVAETDGSFIVTGGAEIKNFILDEPRVEVSDSNFSTPVTSTADDDKTYESASRLSIGFAIGHVGYKASSIGVIGGKLRVGRSSYTTYNSIIGNLGTGVTSDLDGNISSGDTGYFVPDIIMNGAVRQISNDKTGTFSSGNTLYGALEAEIYYDSSIDKVSLTANTPGNGKDLFTFNGNTWLISANDSNNSNASGNFLNLGAFSFTSEDPVSIRSMGTIDDSGTIYDGYTRDKTRIAVAGAESVDDAEYSLNSTEKLNELGNKSLSELVVDSNKNNLSELNFAMRFNGRQADLSDDSVTIVSESNEVVKPASEEITDEENGVTTTTTVNHQYNISGNIIKFNISNIKNASIFVIASKQSSNSSQQYINIYKITDTSNLTAGEKFYLQENYSKFEHDQTDDKNSSLSEVYSNIKYQFPLTSSSGQMVACYIELDENDGNGMYAVGITSSGYNIHYLAVVGIDDGTAGEPIDDYNVSAIDFIYNSVQLLQQASGDLPAFSFVTGSDADGYNEYDPSNVRVYITGSGATIIIAYSRLKTGEGAPTFAITYNTTTSTETTSPYSVAYTGTGTVSIPSSSDSSLEFPD